MRARPVAPIVGVLIVLALAAQTQAREEDSLAAARTNPAVGTFDFKGMIGGEKVRGRIVVRPLDDGSLELSAALEDGRLWRGAAKPPVAAAGTSLRPESIPGPWRFERVVRRSDGDLGRLGEAPRKTFDVSALTIASVSSKLTLARGDETVALERKQHALVVVPPRTKDTQKADRDVRYFASFAEDASSYFASKGMKSRTLTGSWSDVRRVLLEAERAGAPFDRVVFIAHGGVDGPGLGKAATQLSGRLARSSHASATEREDWEALVDAIRRGTSPDARIFVSACRSGGDELYLGAVSDLATYRYADDLATRTGRIVGGPQGLTAAERTMPLIRALEGEGAAIQHTRLATPGGAVIVPEGQTIPGGKDSVGFLSALGETVRVKKTKLAASAGAYIAEMLRGF